MTVLALAALVGPAEPASQSTTERPVADVAYVVAEPAQSMQVAPLCWYVD